MRAKTPLNPSGFPAVGAAWGSVGLPGDVLQLGTAEQAGDIS